jgi:hypothetical protein
MKRRLIVAVCVVLFCVSGLFLAYGQSGSACAGFASRLQVGTIARVLPGDPNNIRALPSSGAERVGQIPAGASFTVIGGPTCADNLTWWQVNFNGIIGWTAEAAANGVYWLEPVSGGSGGGGSPSDALPGDVLAGIAFPAGGGETFIESSCFTISGEIFVALENGVGIFENAGSYERSSTGEFIFVRREGFPNGTTFRLLEGEPTVEIGLGRGFDAYRAPALCARGNYSADDVRVIPPSGVLAEFEAAIINPQSVPDLIEAHLPVEAYLIPGMWRMEIGTFSINYEVLPVHEPTYVIYGDFGGGFAAFNEIESPNDMQTLLLGYEPNSQIAVIDNREGRARIIPTDSVGNVFAPRFVWAIVPESGQPVTLLHGLIVEHSAHFFIPEVYAAQIIYDVVWRGINTDLETWTCPGAPPMRLDPNKVTRVLRSMSMYAAPDFGAQVIRSYQSGDEIRGVTFTTACGENTAWWQLSLYNGETFTFTDGWIPESINGQYVLEPVG